MPDGWGWILAGLSTSGQMFVLVSGLGGSSFPINRLGKLMDIVRRSGKIRRDDSRIKRHLQSMRYDRFENTIERLYESEGYSMTQIRRGPNDGAGFIAVRDDQIMAIQAVQHDEDREVVAKTIRTIYEARDRYEASTGIVISTSGFTKAARRTAEKFDVNVIDGDELVEFIRTKDIEI